ncbi:MAG: sensor histidine kinase, partial [Anaerolineales bacterium]
DAVKSQFILTVTHELRSPVSVTRSLLRNIVAGYAGQVTEQQLDIISRAARRVDFLQKLIDDLLDLAEGKTEARLHEHYEPVPLDAVIQRVIDRFDVPSREKKISLSWHNNAGSDQTLVLATSEGLDRIFNNLVSNAIKYTPAAGEVKVVLSTTGSEAEVSVEDTGIGIPEEAMGKLFEEFYRAPNAKSVEREGTGLGLTIVKDLVNRFGGQISVHSAVDKGSQFKVTLPAVKLETSVPHSNSQTTLPTESPGSAISGRKG